MPRRAPLVMLLLAVFALFAGCASSERYSLKMDKVTPLIMDETVSSSTKSYRKIMIVPPSGDIRAKFEPLLTSAEREFMRRGLTVISAAVTGRVVKDITGKNEGASHLTDTERALIMAKASNADAILHIGDFMQPEDDGRQLDASNSKHWRYFALKKNHMKEDLALVEISAAEFNRNFRWNIGKRGVNQWVNASGLPSTEYQFPRVFSDRVYNVTARLIDVESGEVVVGFQIIAPLVNFTEGYNETLDRKGRVVAKSYVWESDQQEAQRSKAAIETVFSAIADHIVKPGPLHVK